MADQYEGNPNNFPDDFTLPDDSAPPTAFEFNPAFEALGDRTAYVRSRLMVVSIQDFIANATIDVPAGAVAAIIEGCGGGGGGGAGRSSSAVSNSNCGGGGGGGAIRGTKTVLVTPGESLQITIGAGGAGGVAAGITAGSSGGHSQVLRVATSSVIAIFFGASGGAGGVENTYFVNFNGNSSTPNYSFAPGGEPAGDDVGLGGATMYVGALRVATPQAGGPGLSSHTFSVTLGKGRGSGYAQGGNQGTAGTTTGASFKGGGSGGGGGAGPYGNGGGGGSGTSVNESGAAATASAGTAAAANTGAGGGGGGSAGGASSAGGLGGNGGAGGSGFIRITWLSRGSV